MHDSSAQSKATEHINKLIKEKLGIYLLMPLYTNKPMYRNMFSYNSILLLTFNPTVCLIYLNTVL